MMLKREVILSNKCQCRKCGDIIESKTRHDFVWCKCGAIYTDGGLSYIRRGAMDLNDIIDLSETYEEEYEPSNF
jgi:tRNA(Ile2) C34 agmatinyltransferase TiaS